MNGKFFFIFWQSALNPALNQQQSKIKANYSNKVLAKKECEWVVH